MSYGYSGSGEGALRTCKSTTIAIVVMTVFAGLVAPVRADSTTAREDFRALCADCHGADAKGNGPLAANLTKVPPDLTRIKQKAHGIFDRKAVYDWILGLNMTESHGTREMPIWGDWLMDEAMDGGTSLADAKGAEEQVERRVMDIVRYIESLQTRD